jgi:hypothetical protein
MRAPKRQDKAPELTGLSSQSTVVTADPRERNAPLPITVVGMPTAPEAEHTPWTENDIRTIISCLQLLQSWESSLQQSTPESLAA